MSDPAGHDAGFAANFASGQACWIVVNRAGSCFGRVTATERMFAFPVGNDPLTVRLAPVFLLVLACVEAEKTGLNGSVGQFAAWNRVDTPAVAPCVLDSDPSTLNGAQLVGLNMKPGRSIVTLTLRISSRIPSRIVGNGSVVTVIWAVWGSTLTAARTTMFPRLKGPATAGTTTLNPNGAPLYGPVRNTRPPCT